MKIGGLQKFSVIDYPTKTSAVIFTQGCNFRCPFCYNPELVIPEFFAEPYDPQDVLDFLDKRKGKLDAVVVTGGEPTLQDDLLDFLALVKEKGFLIKLDTNGSRPEVLKKAIEGRLVDFIAMDIKAPWDKYASLSGVDVDVTIIQESVRLIQASGLARQFRTTFYFPLLGPEDLNRIANSIGQDDSRFKIQEFVQWADKPILAGQITA